MTFKNEEIMRGTGLLIVEVVNSNINGDPDQGSDPRQRPDGRGEFSPVSFKRKLRDLIDNKEGPVWKSLANSFEPALDSNNFCILESRGRDRNEINKEIKERKFIEKYWDARVFGNTFLEEGASTSIKTGVVQFGLGLSIAPIDIERMTNTNKSGVQEGKDRGMAPLAYRIVPHGVYCMPFFVNPTAAIKSGCTKRDINLMLRTIPYAYTHTASYIRPFVNIRKAWFVEHSSPLGSCSDFEIIDALMPKKKGDSNVPSSSWDEYNVPENLSEKLKSRVKSCCDLMKRV
ncbi:type I CRISPR-associated protein Cas7 [Aminobacterium mobile]|jgi:Cas7 group CRISPR-associated protein Csh2|uniref:type I CRISPR-associated protein Cas7 n=1 Tax=Aminobacterium mobile TaxID=81467 RepID=UPI00331615F0